MPARALHEMVSEYVVANTALRPSTWRAASCMVGGHTYLKSVLKQVRPLPAARGGTGARRMKVKKPGTKIPTHLLTRAGHAAVREVLLGVTPRDAIRQEDVSTLRALASRQRSQCFVTRLPQATARAQRRACEQATGRSTLVAYYCAACTVAHIKLGKGAKHPSKKRFGVVSRMAPSGVLEPLNCATCMVEGWLRPVDLVGHELQARTLPALLPVPITVCTTCGAACQNPAQVGHLPVCEACIVVGLPHDRCPCRDVATTRPGVVATLSGGQRVAMRLCALHELAVAALPPRSEYPAHVLMHVIASSTKPASLKRRRYVYLR
jgi:hypothetical protein